MKQKLHKVRAPSLDAAYDEMRRRFGAEAVVLGTHQVTQGGVFGFFGQRMIELTVSAPVTAPRPRPASPAERKYTAQSHRRKPASTDPKLEEYADLIRNAQQRMKQGPAANRPAAPANQAGAGTPAASPVLPFPKPMAEPTGTSEEVRRELHDLREMMQVIYAESPGAGLPAEFAPHYRTLIQRGVSRKAAARLIASVLKEADLDVMRDPRVFLERLHFEIRRTLNVTGGVALHGGSCRTVVLCGATGVGKTTNLAKMAAHFSVHERARVALITADTYRVAAPEQLRVYANIIGVPLRVANDAKEVAEAVRAFHDHDLVLMDTAGGSQFNLEQISDLKGMLHAARPHETILVMSANTQLEDLRNVVSNFSCLNPTSLMFTKIDETRQYGAPFSILAETGLPLSYLSVGQNVPDDIRTATAEMVASLVLEGKERRG